MELSFNPGRSVPDPDAALLSDPFFLLIESQGREILSRRYDYIANLLEEVFEDDYQRLFRSARLHYEVVNLVSICSKTMQDFSFPRRMANAALRKALIRIISIYLEHGRNT